MRKPDFCICENKDADQLRGYREADQRLCFRYTGSAIPLLPKPEISSFYPSSVAAQLGLCQTLSVDIGQETNDEKLKKNDQTGTQATLTLQLI